MDKGIKNKTTLETTKEFTSKTRRMESNSKPSGLEQLRIIRTTKQRYLIAADGSRNVFILAANR